MCVDVHWGGGGAGGGGVCVCAGAYYGEVQPRMGHYGRKSVTDVSLSAHSHINTSPAATRTLAQSRLTLAQSRLRNAEVVIVQRSTG